MLTNIRPGTLTKGAATFIGKAMTMMSNQVDAETPFGESRVARLIRLSVTMKFIHPHPQTLETQEESDQLQDLLRVARGLALACRFDPRWNGWKALPNPLPGDPVAEIDQIIEDTKPLAVTPPATAAA